MHRSIQLSREFITKESLTSNQRPAFCTLILQDAKAVLYTTKNGQMLLQTIPHYLMAAEVFEYLFDKNTEVDFSVTKGSIRMMVMLSGHSVLRDEQGNLLTESQGNSCYLSYLHAGKYSRTFLEGHHKVLMLTINPRFIIQHEQLFPEMQAVINSYSASKAGYFKLPNAAIAKGIHQLLKKLNDFKGDKTANFDKKVINFLTETLKQYHKNIALRKISSISEQHRAAALALFLENDPYHPLISNKEKMALHFCMCEKNMMRLAKKQFGKSLHQHVIELRMLHALKILLYTENSVQEVADLIGYDRHYFSRAFKQIFGVPPSDIMPQNVYPPQKGSYLDKDFM